MGGVRQLSGRRRAIALQKPRAGATRRFLAAPPRYPRGVPVDHFPSTHATWIDAQLTIAEEGDRAAATGDAAAEGRGRVARFPCRASGSKGSGNGGGGAHDSGKSGWHALPSDRYVG